MEKETKEPKQGVSGGIVCLIVILCLLLGLTSGYILHDKLSNKEEKKTEQKDNQEEKEKDEIKTNYKELDLSNECFNKDLECTKEYSLELNDLSNKIKIEYSIDKTGLDKDFKFYINDKKIKDDFTINSNGYKISKLFLLDNGSIVVEARYGGGDTFFEYYSKDLDLIKQFNIYETELIKKQDLKNFTIDTLNYSLIKNDTFEVEYKTNINNKSKSEKYIPKDKECINSYKECEQNITLADVTIIVKNSKEKIITGQNEETEEITRNIYLGNKLIEKENKLNTIKEIGILDNGLIAIDYYDDFVSNNEIVYRKYYLKDSTILLDTSNNSYLYNNLQGNILDKESTLTEKEIIDKRNDFNYTTEEIIHEKKISILSGNKYQIKSIKTEYKTKKWED